MKMRSKPSDGFELVLGHLYNDNWFNDEEPNHHSGIHCQKCNTEVTIFKLRKNIFAFGMVIRKYCKVECCPYCLNEIATFPNSKTKVFRSNPSRANFLKKFRSLSKEIQEKLIKEVLNDKKEGDN